MVMDYSLAGHIFNDTNFGLSNTLLPLILLGITTLAITRNPRHYTLTVFPLSIALRQIGLYIPWPVIYVLAIVWTVMLFTSEGMGETLSSAVKATQESMEGLAKYGTLRTSSDKRLTIEKARLYHKQLTDKIESEQRGFQAAKATHGLQLAENLRRHELGLETLRDKQTYNETMRKDLAAALKEQARLDYQKKFRELITKTNLKKRVDEYKKNPIPYLTSELIYRRSKKIMPKKKITIET